MRVVVTGASGQLGTELQAICPGNVELYAAPRNELDITSVDSIDKYFQRVKPNVIINAAAYTNVEHAEEEKEIAFRVNVKGVENLVLAASKFSSRIIHVSTDYVFSGENSTPYLPTDKAEPLNHYGNTKLLSENAVHKLTEGEGLVIRSGWLYSSHGSNFVKTMLSLYAKKEQVNVIADQVGIPTWVRGLSEAVWDIVVNKPYLKGSYHWGYTGVASWFDFSIAISEEAYALGLIDRMPQINAIRTSEYKSKVLRPRYSVLDCYGLWGVLGGQPVHWRSALREMMREYAEHSNKNIKG